MHDTDDQADELQHTTHNTPYDASERPWIVLSTTYDVETWIDHYNRDLAQAMQKKNDSGHGICFRLAAGGDIFMHTTSEGDILLDVTPEAQWVTPAIVAATQMPDPQAPLWMLPAHVLTQLVLGLSSLIGSTVIVHEHDFRIRKKFSRLE
jgi:hypothetical protein